MPGHFSVESLIKYPTAEAVGYFVSLCALRVRRILYAAVGGKPPVQVQDSVVHDIGRTKIGRRSCYPSPRPTSPSGKRAGPPPPSKCPGCPAGTPPASLPLLPGEGDP